MTTVYKEVGMVDLSKQRLLAEWNKVLDVAAGVRVDQGYCTEGFVYVKQSEGALTDLEARILLSFRINGSGMMLVFTPPDGDEREVLLSPDEKSALLDILLGMADFGLISTGFAGGTRTDFVVRVDRNGELYLLPPNTRATVADLPLTQEQLFISIRLLNFIEAL